MIRGLGFLALLFAAFAGRAAAQTVSARVGGELTGFMDSSVAVPITVDMAAAGGAKLGSYTARLEWAPGVLEFDEFFTGDFSTPFINTDSMTQGVLRFSAISAPGKPGLVTLGYLTFEVLVDASSPMNLTFSEMSASGTFTDLLPSLTVTSATFCAARGLWGDLDQDGLANSRDALAILSSVVGLNVSEVFDLTLGDVDGDGKTNTRDALIILSYAVGLDIPGQRVLLPAASGCGTGSARQLTVLPGAIDLAVGQSFQMSARITDLAGNAVSLTGATWRSSDVTVVGVDEDGELEARNAGTAVVTVEAAPGVRGTATVTVMARRPNWYVDITATGDPFQNGSAARPFEHPLSAFEVLQEGDTIRVTPGTYMFEEDGILTRGAVIIGGTAGDTTTRPVFRDPDHDYDGLRLEGGIRTVVRNVVLDNFYYGVHLLGVRSFVLEDSRIQQHAGEYGYGIYACAGNMDTVRVERSLVVGEAAGIGGDGIYFGSCGLTGTLVVRDSKIRYWEQGIRTARVDSVAVIRSVVSDINDEGIVVLGVECDCAPPVTGSGVAAAPPYDGSVSLYISQSRVDNTGWRAVSAYSVRRFVLDTSVIRTRGPSIEVQGGGFSNAQMYLRGDSIYYENTGGYSWLSTSGVDTLLVDRMVLRFPADTSVNVNSDINAEKIFLTHSKFLNVGNDATPWNAYSAYAMVDDVQASGCAVVDCVTGEGLSFYSSGGGLDATVINSQFSRLALGVYLGDGTGVRRVNGLTMDSVGVGIDVSGDSVAVKDNVLTRVYGAGINASSSGSSTIRSLIEGNSVSCVGTGLLGFNLSNLAFLVENDTLTTCNTGMYLQDLRAGSLIHLNTVRQSAQAGIRTSQANGINIAVDSNGVSNSGIGIEVLAGSPELVGNNLRDNTNGMMFQVSGGGLHQVHLNAFVGNITAGIASPNDSVNAQQNWWGAAAQPCTGGADCITGRVDTTAVLAADPVGSQWLTPPAREGPLPSPAAPRSQAVRQELDKPKN